MTDQRGSLSCSANFELILRGILHIYYTSGKEGNYFLKQANFLFFSVCMPDVWLWNLYSEYV